MNASIEIQNGVKTLSSAPADAKYYNNSGAPYTNVAEVNSQIPSALRGRGLTVNVAGVEYWYKDGILDTDLVVKITEAHTHGNKNTLDKITESENLPLWNGSAWPGSGGAAPTADNVNTALQAFTEGTPTGDSYLPFIGKVKAKLSAVTNVIATLLANTFAAKTHGHTKSDISDFPTLFSGAWADLTGKPTLFSGSYTDLTNKPTLHTHSNKSVMDEIQVALTNELKNDYDDAYVHAGSTHAPANAQANVIESIKVNGMALIPDVNKEVNIEVPSSQDLTDLNNEITDMKKLIYAAL